MEDVSCVVLVRRSGRGLDGAPCQGPVFGALVGVLWGESESHEARAEAAGVRAGHSSLGANDVILAGCRPETVLGSVRSVAASNGRFRKGRIVSRSGDGFRQVPSLFELKLYYTLPSIIVAKVAFFASSNSQKLSPCPLGVPSAGPSAIAEHCLSRTHSLPAALPPADGGAWLLLSLTS